MTRKPKIAVIGLSGESVFMHVEHFHQPGETLFSNSLYVEPGGKGFNQAVACARLQAEVSFLSAVGDDDYGEKCRSLLLKEQIRPYLIQKKNEHTSFASILTNRVGETQVTVFPGATLSEVDILGFFEEIKSSQALLIQLEVSFEVLLRAIQIAHDAKVMVILNPAPYQSLTEEILSMVSILTPNEVEAKMIAQVDAKDDISQVIPYFQKLGKDTIITLGEKGALIISKSKHSFVPSIPVKCIDSTGAGDAFNAALCIKMLEKKDLVEAVKWANVVAGLSVQKPYVLDSYPTIDEVLAYLKEKEIVL
jgi:ribokinase